MPDTGRSIITTALQWIKAYSPAERITDSDIELGLDQLNAMMDSYSTESLSCFATYEQSFALQVGVQSYTIGTGGVINQTRPIRITEGPGAAYVRDANNNDFQVEVVTRDKWNQIGDKANTSDLPTTLFYDNQFPLGIINVWPIPLIAYTMYFDSFRQLTQLATVNTTFTFPPGYKAFITSNLAVWLKPFFKSAVIDGDLRRTARDTKMNVKRANRRTPISNIDAAMLNRGLASYNVYTDSSSN